MTASYLALCLLAATAQTDEWPQWRGPTRLGVWTEIGRTQLLARATRTRGGATGRWGDHGVVWSHPAYANRHIVMRNDKEIVRISLAADDYR